jgi:hypothetical protein
MPATASAKKIIAAIAIPAVSVIANVRPRLLVSISASVNFALSANGLCTASSAIAISRSADPGTTLSYAASSAAGGIGEFQEYPTTSRLAPTAGKCSSNGRSPETCGSRLLRSAKLPRLSEPATSRPVAGFPASCVASGRGPALCTRIPSSLSASPLTASPAPSPNSSEGGSAPTLNYNLPSRVRPRH